MKSDASGTVKDETKTDKPLVGVGGWLAFFIIALMLIGPLYSIQELASEFRTLEAGGSFLTNHPAYIQMKWFCWIMLFLWIGLREWTGYLLLHRHVWKTVRIEIFDGAHDDTVVGPVTDHFHFEFFPADQRFLDQQFAGR